MSILVLATLKTATWAGETCWWPLCKKNYIHRNHKAYVVSL